MATTLVRSEDIEKMVTQRPSCSFCGKGPNEVQQLIRGGTVFICDECADLCAEILDAKRGNLLDLPTVVEEARALRVEMVALMAGAKALKLSLDAHERRLLREERARKRSQPQTS